MPRLSLKLVIWFLQNLAFMVGLLIRKANYNNNSTYYINRTFFRCKCNNIFATRSKMPEKYFLIGCLIKLVRNPILNLMTYWTITRPHFTAKINNYRHFCSRILTILVLLMNNMMLPNQLSKFLPLLCRKQFYLMILFDQWTL